MKQMPVESFFFALGRRISAASSRTWVFFNSPTGNSVRAQLPLVQAVQEVALVLGAVKALEQLEVAIAFSHPGVVTGGDVFGPQPQRVIEKRLELDLGVAQHVRIRRAAGLVFAQELGEHAVFVLGGEVDVLELDADHVGHRGGVDEIDVRRAVFAVVVILPVLHEDADHFVALALE